MQDLGINCPSLCSLMCPVYLRFGDSISLPLLPCLSCLGDSSSLYLTPLSICLPETWLQFGDSLSAFPCLFSLTYLRGYLYVCPCVAYPRDYPVPLLPTWQAPCFPVLPTWQGYPLPCLSYLHATRWGVHKSWQTPNNMIYVIYILFANNIHAIL